jgi:acyl-CoA thioester hydrolase
VYYSRYLDLLEEARGELFRSLGKSFRQWQEESDVTLPVIEIGLRYRVPARYDDLLSIEVAVTHAGGVRLNFAYRVLDERGTLLVEGETAHVCADSAGKPKRLPGQLLEALSPFLGRAPG